MARRVRCRTTIALLGAVAFLRISGLPAAEPPVDRGAKPWLEVPFADPQRFFERLFGQESAEDKRALAGIEISPKEERQFGQEATNAFLADLRRQGIQVVRRGRDVEYLRDLIATIRPLMTNRSRYGTITVCLADSPRQNARVFPGGTIVFFRGLLEAALSEAALVGLIGHELSHLDREHLLVRARRLKLAQQTFSAPNRGLSPERFFSLGSTALRVWTHPFQPGDEAEADADGARWAFQAGYDPREFARLLADAEKRQTGLEGLLPPFLQSHPPPAERREAILKLYEQLQQQDPKEKLYVGRENLRRRIARSRKPFAE